MTRIRNRCLSSLSGSLLLFLFSAVYAGAQVNSPGYLYQQALAQFGESNYTSAREFIHGAVQREESFKYFYLAGLVDLRLENYTSAIRNLARSLEIIPEGTNPHNAKYNLAFAYWKNGQHELAETLLRDCETKEARKLLGYISFEKGLQIILSTHQTLPGTRKDLAYELLTSFQANSNDINFIDDTPIIDPPVFSEHSLPGHVLQVADGQIFIWTSKNQQVTYIIQRQGEGFTVLEAYHSSTGRIPGEKQRRGDEKTPTGIYFPVSKMTTNQMPQRYGAYAFPVNYPNHLDKHLGRTGSGIWLHGINENDNGQIPYNSEGCVVFSNEGIFGVSRHIVLRETPVILAEDFIFLTQEEVAAKREDLLQTLHRWRDDWASLDHDAYMSHYAENFSAGRFNRNTWSSDKARINRRKTFIEIEMEDISLFLYPELENGKEVALATFNQVYRSSNFNSDSFKFVYLVKENGHWKIITEGSF